jgi:acyl-CoA thioesterase-1
LLAAQQRIDVRDLSQMGAKVRSARKQAERLGNEDGLVLLEIGGNDLLGATTPEEFEEGLEQLLQDVCRPGRTVVMIELPLTPFANRFGLSQRKLAQQHGVYLVPRRIFVSVLTAPGATLDGIHLSPAGHELMAETIWEQIREAYESGA